jgi:hypothetical protein
MPLSICSSPTREIVEAPAHIPRDFINFSSNYTLNPYNGCRSNDTCLMLQFQISFLFSIIAHVPGLNCQTVFLFRTSVKIGFLCKNSNPEIKAWVYLPEVYPRKSNKSTGIR